MSTIGKIASSKILSSIITAVAISMAVYHLLSAFVIIQGTTTHYITHLGFVLVLGLLIQVRDKTKIKRYIAVGAILVTIAVIPYIFVNSERLEGTFGFIKDIDLIFGFALVAVVFIAAWLAWGIIIPTVIAVGIAYFIWGHLLSGYMYHPQYNIKYIISGLGISLTTGVFGSLISISANTIIFFMVFGATMESMGLTPAFLEVGKAIGKVLRGGPAYMALVGSSLLAMVSGAATGNVAITGTFTIPAMKSAGFERNHAGAIECVCSAGGQITPPVMGAAAFIMAAFIGVPYFVIMQKAVIGAIVFYVVAFIGILFYSYATGQRRYKGAVSVKTILARLPIFIVGLATVLWMMLKAYSIGLACSSAVLAVIVLAVLLVPESRSIKTIGSGLAKGAIWGAQLGIILSLIGMLATIVVTTGLAPKGTAALMALTGGALLPSLILIAILGIILGMGVPISAAYTILALMLVPGLTKLGVNIFAAHFFALYFSCWSVITPPYAPAAMVASKLSGGNFWTTGFLAMKLMIVPMIFPFIIALNPTLLEFPVSVGIREVVLIALTILAGIGVSTVMFRWFVSRTTTLSYVLAWLSVTGIVTYLLGASYILLIIGLSAMAVMALIQITKLVVQRREVMVT